MSLGWRRKVRLFFAPTPTGRTLVQIAVPHRHSSFFMKCLLILPLSFISLFLILSLSFISLFLARVMSHKQITVQWTSTEQTIDGFGAEAASDISLPPSRMNFFYTDAGIHLTFLRVEIIPDAADCESLYGTGHCVPSANATVLRTALANAQAATSRGALVWGTEGSPPGYMKSNGRWGTGGSFLGGAANFAKYAAIQTSFVSLMASNGVPVYAVSVQNEPDVSEDYPTCTWTAQQIHDYIPYLSATLSSAGYGSVKIMIDEESTWTNTLSEAVMHDAAVASQIGILAEHAYGGKASRLTWNNITTQHVWQTEVSDLTSYDGSIASGLKYAAQIHNWLTTAMVNSWHYFDITHSGDTNDNEALTDTSFNIAKRAYTIGQFAKFARAGWTRVDVTNSTGLLVSAYKGPNGASIVVVNNGSAVNSQTFSVGTIMGSSVRPWITSSTQNLAPQTPVIVSSGAFTYTIPAKSVVTFSTPLTPTVSAGWHCPSAVEPNLASAALVR